jgi:tRNA(Ile)-lysidine synthase TilS/MesJ
MLSEFENKVLNFIKANGLFEPAGKVLLAVSGGADSMGLLHCLAVNLRTYQSSFARQRFRPG